jgi:divinyl protochlorophyllide a 8-vinyl-reductase
MAGAPAVATLGDTVGMGDVIPLREGVLHGGGARIGPNAVIQTAAALRALGGEASAAAIFRRAGVLHWLTRPPAEMAGEQAVAALHRVVAQEAPAAAAEAGRLTADYLLANRIPKPAQAVMRRLPGPLAARLLLMAVARNAWTFAGSGAVKVAGWATPRITIHDNPIATPGCPWHAAVFARLFSELATPGAEVIEHSCCGRGDDACRFEIRRGPRT